MTTYYRYIFLCLFIYLPTNGSDNKQQEKPQPLFDSAVHNLQQLATCMQKNPKIPLEQDNRELLIKIINNGSTQQSGASTNPQTPNLTTLSDSDLVAHALKTTEQRAQQYAHILLK
jgi:hypothetical protein